jgi:putative restriction endonuclease
MKPSAVDISDVKCSDSQGLVQLFRDVKCHKVKGRRTPHKSLLLLIALSRLKAGHQRLTGFTDYEALLKPLLKQFNPNVKQQNCAYPFWWLQNDGLWEVAPNGLKKRASSGDPPRSELVSRNAVGGFTEQVFVQVRKDKKLYDLIVASLLTEHFSTEQRVHLFNWMKL